MVRPGLQAISNNQVVAGIDAKNRERSKCSEMPQTTAASEVEAGIFDERKPEKPCCAEKLYPGESEVMAARGEPVPQHINQSTGESPLSHLVVINTASVYAVTIRDRSHSPHHALNRNLKFPVSMLHWLH